jgi:hypothetical protein
MRVETNHAGASDQVFGRDYQAGAPDDGYLRHYGLGSSPARVHWVSPLWFLAPLGAIRAGLFLSARPAG